MKTTLILTAILLCTLAQAQQPDLQSLKAKYAGAKSNIEAQAFSDYTNGLQTLKQQAQQAGDLDTLQGALTELQSVQTRRTFSATTAPVSLRGFATALERQTIRRQYELATQYSRALLALQVLKTQQGDVAGATAVQHEGEAARFILAELSSQIPPEPVAVPQTNQVEVAPQLTKPHHPDIGEKMLGVWSIEQGYYNILSGGVYELIPGGAGAKPCSTGTWEVRSNKVYLVGGGFSHEITMKSDNLAILVRGDGQIYTIRRTHLPKVPQTNQGEVAPRLTKPHQTDIGEKMLGKWSINGGWFEMLPDGEVNNPWGVPGCNWKVSGSVLIVDTGEHSHKITMTGSNTARCVRDDGVVLKMKRLDAENATRP